MEERNHLQEAAEWLAAYEDYSTSNYSPEAAYRMAQLRTSLALAEATRPRWVQIGARVINLAHVAHINLASQDADGRQRVEVTFVGGDLLHFAGQDYKQAVITLSNALYGYMADRESDEE